MSKLTKIIMLSSLLVMLSGAASHAFLLPPGPVSPTADPGTDVLFGLRNVGATAQQYAAQMQAYANEATQKVKAAKKKYMEQFTGFMGGLFKKKEKAAIPGSKTIQESKIADIYDPESVKKALYTLFMAYPIDCDKNAENFAACAAYKQKAEEFYQDTVIEIYTSVRLMEQTMAELTAEVENLSSTFTGVGGGGAESGDDENGVWKNAFNAYQTMNSILKLTQEISAMRAQYEAVLFLREQVTPAPYVSKKEREAKEKASKTSSNQTNEQVKIASSGIYRHSETLAFGQLGLVQADFALTKNKQQPVVVEEEIDDEDYEYDPALYGSVSFADAPKMPLKSAFDGNREKLLELDKIAPLYEKVQDAKEVHNLIQSLDSYRGIFENYEQYKKLHQKSLEAVAASDQCAIQYLNRYYSNPEKVWKGTMPDAAINDYDARQGISGWAVKAFEIAKSEEAVPFDDEDLGTIDIDMSLDVNDPESEKKFQEQIEKQKDSALVNPSQQEEIEKTARESQMISFNIGAQAAQLLVEDQYKQSPQWGVPTVKFPVWKDQINFYSQYLGGKYANIKDYLHQLDVSAVIIDLAYSLNDLTVSDEKERANNRAGLDKLSARLAKEEDGSNPATVLKDLENNRSQMLAEVLQRKNSRLQALNSQKKTLQNRIDNASEILSGNNEQLNVARQEKLEAEAGIAVKEKQIKYLDERRGEDEDNLIRTTDIEYSEESFELSPEKTEQIHSIKREEVKEKKLLFDTGEVLSEYNEKVQKLQYEAKQQEAAKAVEENNQKARQQLMRTNTNSNMDGSLSLYPENKASSTGKKSLFRRPFSDNSDFAPLSAPKYALSQTLYFGAEYPTKQINYQQEKAKLDAALDEKISSQTEESRIVEDTEVREQTIDAVETTYSRATVSETMEINEEDGEDMALAKVQLSENQENAAANEKKAAQLKSFSEQKGQEISSLSRQIENVDQQIKAVEADYAAQVQKIEQAYYQKLEEAQKYIESKRQAKKTLDLIGYYKDKIGLPVAGAGGILPPFSLLNILSAATGLTDDTKNYADQLVDEAHKSILNLGDGLYVGEYGDKVVKIHTNLMDQLQSMPVEGLSEFSSAVGAYAKTNSIIKPLTSLFQKLMQEQACAGDNCKRVDTAYFVGAYAKGRDFMVPKAAPREYLPPLREVVHFDDVDYDNIPQAADGGIARESFLNSGSKMPEIWKRILDGKAFVEKDVDLKTLLAEGNETPSFMRGGRYPCRLGDHIIDVKNADGQYSVYTNKILSSKATAEEKAYRPAQMAKMPQCNDITIQSKGGLLGNLYVTVEDKIEEVTAPAKVVLFQEFSGSTSHSELGTLLRAGDNGIYFNVAPETVLSRLSKMAEETSQENNSYQKNMQDEVYKKTLLNKNQFGNFLTFVEQEISYRQALEELKLSVDEAKETLLEQLEKAGFKPSADYNLAKQEDYDLTKNTLNRRKNTLVNEGFEEMEAVQVKDNDVVEERLSKIRNILTALRKDKNAYIPLTDVTDSGASLDESIKTEEVNRQVTEEYKKRADEEFEKQIKSYPIPFCAAY